MPSTTSTSVLKIIIAEFLRFALVMVFGATVVAILGFAPPTVSVTSQFVSAPNGVDYLRTVGRYLAGLPRGEFGRTRRGLPVATTIGPATQRSLILLAISSVLAVPVGLFGGMLLANTRHRLLAPVLFSTLLVILSLPTFLVLLLLVEAVATFTLRTGIQLTPIQGYGMDRRLILPTAVLVLAGSAYLARALQIEYEQILEQDWIRYARAKGLAGWQLWRRHVLPALWLPLIGCLLGMLRVIVGSLIIVEYIYQWRGLGSLLVYITQVGLRPTEGTVAASAGFIFLLFFCAVDGLGRIVTALARQRMAG